MAITGNQREDRVSTPALNQTLNVYGTPGASKTSTVNTGKKTTTVPTETKAQIDASIAATNAKLQPTLDKAKAYVEKQGYVIDPNTGLYVASTPTGDGTGGGGSTGGGEKLTPEQYAAQQAAKLAADAALKDRQSAYDILYNEFTKYGLGALVEPLKGLIQSNVSPSQFSLELQNTDAYKKRFAANAARIEKGLKALSPAEYIGLEDQYQNIMRNYGLPDSYWKKGDLGIQEGFTKLLANDVSATELEDRVMTAQNRVVNANPQVKEALKKFYPDITDGDILAYSLDPQKALTDIKRKVTAAEIGGAALGQGLSTSQLAAEGLANYGITKQQAEQGYGTIAELLPTAQKLAGIYKEQPYTQQQAESEIFNLANSAEAAKKRKKLAAQEQATFSGSSGTSGGALARDRALNNQTYGAPGAGAY
jgi:hypothetical protein